MEYKDARKLASIIFEASGHRVRVDQFYARRGESMQRSAILSQFKKSELLDFLENNTNINGFNAESQQLIQEFEAKTVQETIENDYIIS
ncbi:hypothetical protein [Photobacterium damselae]|uniref:hypothetical protein n=1 Tax=Photobacterium damselae TaxID=38293 RepID=UPI001F167BCB|nr:hypothetical protein [Photobacterium damselae]UKA04871.1 hypothetical protein IHC89_21750 [Photobacterium damselae subsp. damselae]